MKAYSQTHSFVVLALNNAFIIQTVALLESLDHCCIRLSILFSENSYHNRSELLAISQICIHQDTSRQRGQIVF